MEYRIEGLDPVEFAPLFGLDDRALLERGVYRYRAEKDSGLPCRVLLEDAAPGSHLLLVNHLSRDDRTPYRARHAIFVTEGATVAARFDNEVPPVMTERWLSLRGFGADGMMKDALLIEPGGADAGLRKLFEDPTIVEIDVHNAVRGCFSARARRV